MILLNSYCALLPAVLLTIGLIVRTVFEDRTLQDGYREYTRQVRFRL